MATAPRTGLNPARKVGSGPDNKGLTTYTIASGYATALGIGDPVKLSSGTIIKATNGADAIGVFMGCDYFDDTNKLIKYSGYWPASQTSTQTIYAKVLDDPFATFHVKADGVVTQVVPGNLYAANLTAAADAATMRSQLTAKVIATVTGSLDASGQTDMGANLTGIDDADAFTLKSSVANVASTITIGTTETTASFVAQLEAVAGITASIASGTGFITITAEDGGSIVLTDGSGTPLADAPTLLTTAGTTTATAAAGSALLKVVKVVDVDNHVLEVVLSRHSMRDDD